MKIPKIPKDYYSHFIRGYFDGDGSVCISKNQNRLIFSMAGPYEFMERIRDNMVKTLDINDNSVFVKYEKEYLVFSQIAWSAKKDLKKIYKWLYKDYNKSIYLGRKKLIFDNAEKLNYFEYKNKVNNLGAS